MNRCERHITQLSLCCFLLLCITNNALGSSVDYTDIKNWAALPTISNHSMHVPAPGLQNRQSTAQADVFYIYPTIFTSFFFNNASVDNQAYREAVGRLLLSSQASALNNVGKIYAPYYRQASLWAYMDSKKARKKAFDIAYSDIEQAFLHYLRHYNRGRPLFILSHSQGSQIAVRLLRKHYRKLQLSRLLVAAYIIGERIGTETFAELAPCITASQTNCFVTWGTVARGGRSEMMTGKARGRPVCINPLSWRMDEQWVSADHHLGGVPDSFDRVLPRLVGARCRNGLLHVEPAPTGFAHDGKDYHASDINLFYMDIRHNATQRLRQYLRQQP